MRHVKWMNLVAAAAVLLLTTAGWAADPAEPTPGEVVPGEKIEVQAAPDAVKSSQYWIGVMCCSSLDAPLRAHVKLPDNQGLLIRTVVPEGPGAKAGLQPMDILLTANDKPLAKIADLVAAVEASEGKELTIVALRGGERLTLQVTPEPRPAEFQDRHYPDAPEQPEMQGIYQWFERMHPGWGGKPPMRLRFFHPGMLLPADAPMHPDLPDGMSIAIVKKGGEFARITVNQDEKTWEVTEKELDQLPPEVRAHVDRMLQGVVFGVGGASPRFDFVPDWSASAKPDKPDQALRDRLEQRLETMSQRMEQLQEAVEQLRATSGPEQEK